MPDFDIFTGSDWAKAPDAEKKSEVNKINMDFITKQYHNDRK